MNIFFFVILEINLVLVHNSTCALVERIFAPASNKSGRDKKTIYTYNLEVVAVINGRYSSGSVV